MWLRERCGGTLIGSMFWLFLALSFAPTNSANPLCTAIEEESMDGIEASLEWQYIECSKKMNALQLAISRGLGNVALMILDILKDDEQNINLFRPILGDELQKDALPFIIDMIKCFRDVSGGGKSINSRKQAIAAHMLGYVEVDRGSGGTGKQGIERFMDGVEFMSSSNLEVMNLEAFLTHWFPKIKANTIVRAESDSDELWIQKLYLNLCGVCTWMKDKEKWMKKKGEWMEGVQVDDAPLNPPKLPKFYNVDNDDDDDDAVSISEAVNQCENVPLTPQCFNAFMGNTGPRIPEDENLEDEEGNQLNFELFQDLMTKGPFDLSI